MKGKILTIKERLIGKKFRWHGINEIKHSGVIEKVVECTVEVRDDKNGTVYIIPHYKEIKESPHD